jgi:hypothetical protein
VGTAFTERNLNPKAACLKRREEEKTEELPGRQLCPPSTDLHHAAAMAGKVSVTSQHFTSISSFAFPASGLLEQGFVPSVSPPFFPLHIFFWFLGEEFIF